MSQSNPVRDLHHILLSNLVDLDAKMKAKNLLKPGFIGGTEEQAESKEARWSFIPGEAAILEKTGFNFQIKYRFGKISARND